MPVYTTKKEGNKIVSRDNSGNVVRSTNISNTSNSSSNRSSGSSGGSSGGATIISGTLGNAELDKKAGNTTSGSSSNAKPTLNVSQAALITFQKQGYTTQDIQNKTGMNINVTQSSQEAINRAINSNISNNNTGTIPQSLNNTLNKILEKENQSPTNSKITSIDYGKVNVVLPQVQTQPYVKEEIVRIEKINNKEVPIVKYTYVDPTGIGVQKERPATESEIKSIKDEKKSLSLEKGTASTEKLKVYTPLIDKIVKEYNTLNEDLRISITSPISEAVSFGLKNAREITGNEAIPTTLEEARTNAIQTTEYLKSLGINKELANIGEGVTGIGIGILEDVKNNPLNQIALYGTGYALGAGVKGVSIGLSAIPKVGGFATTTFKTGALGYGIYATSEEIQKTYLELQKEGTSLEKGSVLGKEIKDFFLIGKGFEGGQRGVEILKSNINTKYLETLKDLPQGEYPQAPIDSQLALFRKNVYPQVSKEPIAFHTTSEKFFNNGVIKPTQGGSEIGGLYVSTQISTPFARIKGSGSEIPKTIEQFYKSIIESLGKEKQPAIAGLIPKGFKQGEVAYSKVKLFEGQKYIKNKGYAYFKNSPSEGVLELPSIKTEIEAIARPDAGEYLATGQKFKTEIKGVKVEIDIFQAANKRLEKNMEDFADNIKKNTKLQEGGYKGYREYSVVEKIPSINLNPSKSSSKTESSNISSSGVDPSSISSSIERSLSNLRSSIERSQNNSSNSIYSSNNSSSGGYSSNSTSNTSSNKSSINQSNKSKLSSNITFNSLVEQTFTSKSKSNQNNQEKKSKKKLGTGYNVFGKIIRTNKFERLNNRPLTEERAKDIGTYYVDQTVARTFKISKASASAEEDYQFNYIPQGYYRSRKDTLREFRIRKGQPFAIGQQFIEKNKFISDTKAEKRSLKEFQRQARAILR